MKLLDRYLGKQILSTSLFAIAVLSLVLVLGNIFKKLLDLLVNHDVPLDTILTFIAYILPFSFTYTIPWGFLTATLLVFGRMSAENELVALRSSGMSILRIAAPLFALSIVACGICLWINLDVAPRAQEKMRRALFEMATSNPLSMFGSDQVIDEFPGHKIYVERKEGTELFNLTMYQLNEDDEPLRVVVAKRGSVTTDLENQQVLLRLFDARYEQRDELNPNRIDEVKGGISMEEGTLPISLTALYEKNRKRSGVSQMTIDQLIHSEDAADKAEARVELSKRFSFSLASFAFALIGVPLAITAHRRETSIGFLFSLVIALVYFSFIIFAETVREHPEKHPEFLFWLPNIVFVSLGIVLFYRLNRR
jgi:lipopolysaccharide export system permease protein